MNPILFVVFYTSASGVSSPAETTCSAVVYNRLKARPHAAAAAAAKKKEDMQLQAYYF